MARDKGDESGKRRWGRGKAEEGPSEEELGWLADLRGPSRDERPFGDEPRSRRAGRVVEEPKTGAAATPGTTGPASGLGTRPIRRTPPLPDAAAPSAPATPAPSSPAPPSPPTPPSRGFLRRSQPSPAPAPAPEGPPAQPTPPSRGFLRRTPRTPPPEPPPVPPLPPLRSGATRSSDRLSEWPGGERTPDRPAPDWSDETGELPAASELRGRGRTGDLRTGDLRTGDLRADVRTGDVRTPPPPPAPLPPSPPTVSPAPAMPPAPPAVPPSPAPAGRVGDGLRTGAVRTPAPVGPAAAPAPPAPPPLPPVPPPPPPPPLPGPAAAAEMVTTGMIRRAEIRKQIKINQQLKGITLVLVVVLLLAAYPVYLFTRTFAQDPVFMGLDGLNLPEWAAYEHDDAAEGSRWCIGECRARQRTYLSEQDPLSTQPVYAEALLADGWRLRQENCPPSSEQSVITCWYKDEYVMLLHVYVPSASSCEVPPSREPIPGMTLPPATSSNRICPASFVTMYISNAIDDLSRI